MSAINPPINVWGTYFKEGRGAYSRVGGRGRGKGGLI